MKADGYPDIDPWVVDWFEEHGFLMDPPEAYTPEVLAMMRPTSSEPPSTDVGTMPHGFLNLDFPAAVEVYDAAGRWLRDVFAATG